MFNFYSLIRYVGLPCALLICVQFFSSSVKKEISPIFVVQDSGDYFTFDQGIKREFNPYWGALYIEFNYNKELRSLSQEEIRSIKRQYEDDLKKIGLIRSNPKEHAYQIIGGRKRREEVIKILQSHEAVQKMEALYEEDGRSYFSRTIEVILIESLNEDAINKLFEEMNLDRLYIDQSEKEPVAYLTFSEEAVLSYEFLQEAQRLYTNPSVVKVITSHIENVGPN